MKVLVSCKTTNLNVYGEAVKSKISKGSLSTDHLQKLTMDHDHHYQSRTTLLSELERYGIQYVIVRRGLFWPDLGDVDAVVTVGGDGTLLEASHHINAEDVPILGLKSSPMSVGHLCSFSEEQIVDMVDQLANNKLKVTPLTRLQAEVHFTSNGGRLSTGPVLNDFLYTNANPAGTSRYRLRVGDITEDHKSSGLWLSTAAGSTAAISAAGGKVMDLNDTHSQYWVRELYTAPGAVKAKLTHGLVDLNKKPISIENHCDRAILALDGRRSSIELTYGDLVNFSKAKPLRVLRSSRH